jgi:NTP pyrophosphatase (non-canonical NTP hydrolase)
MAEHGQREIANSKEKLEAQLAHCLWSVIILAQMHDVKLENSFMEAMDRLENHLLETQD